MSIRKEDEVNIRRVVGSTKRIVKGDSPHTPDYRIRREWALTLNCGHVVYRYAGRDWRQSPPLKVLCLECKGESSG